MNETELRAWLEALPSDKTELERIRAELQEQRNTASDAQIAAVREGPEAAQEAMRVLNEVKNKLEIVELELNC